MVTTGNHVPVPIDAVQDPPDPPPASIVAVRRRTVDAVLIGLGAAVAVVLVISGSLLTWGSRFADDYVHDELAAQNIFFPDRESLEGQGRGDLVGFAGEQVTDGDGAEAYASYIDGHLEGIAGGATYADLGAVEREARAAVTTATESGASEAEIAELQATADEITGQRDSLFRGETLRGLLLSTFAWSTIGRIAGIAAVVSFAFAAGMFVLVALGVVHHRRTARA